MFNAFILLDICELYLRVGDGIAVRHPGGCLMQASDAAPKRILQICVHLCPIFHMAQGLKVD